MVRPVNNQTSIILIWSDHTRTVGPYEYTHMVMTIRVWSKYSYGPEHIHVSASYYDILELALCIMIPSLKAFA